MTESNEKEMRNKRIIILTQFTNSFTKAFEIEEALNS